MLSTILKTKIKLKLIRRQDTMIPMSIISIMVPGLDERDAEFRKPILPAPSAPPRLSTCSGMNVPSN
eukprot:5952020-Amphidinium_carterae.1